MPLEYVFQRIVILMTILLLCPCAFAMKNDKLLKDPEVKALYIRATKSWLTKEGMKRGDSLRAIGEERRDPVIIALAAEVKENYMYVNGTEKEYYQASDELQKAMKEAGLNYQYFGAIYSAIIYDCNHDHTVRALRRASQMQKEVLKSKDKRAMYLTLRSNGIVYDMRGNYPLAIEYLNKALVYAKQNKMNGTDLAVLYADLASIYYSNNEYEKGLEVANNIFGVAEGDIELLVDAYSKRCHILYELKRYEQFDSEFAKLEELLKKKPELAELNECVWARALKLILSDKLAEARKLIYAFESPEDSLDVDMTIAVKNGDYKRAYELSERYHEYLQNAQNKLDQDEIIELSSELGMAQLQNEASDLRSNRQHMVNIIVVIVVILFLVVSATGFFHIYKRRIGRQRKKIVEERELFYRNVAHQLRTPMTVVLGMVSQIKTRLVNGEKIDIESIEATERQSNNLLSLIKQLIEASKEGKLEAAFMSKEGDLITAPSINHDPVPNHPALQKNAFLELSGSGTSHIMIAEDNDDVALLICNMLHDQGYSITRAADGQEAWEMMQDELPDLLLTDIAMPRMDGLELIRRVRGDDTMSHLPIIVVSARVEDSERIEGISAGAEVYLAKPFINEELILRVHKILEQRENLRQRFSNGDIEVPAAVKDVKETSAAAQPDAGSDVSAGGMKMSDINEEEKEFMTKVNALIDDNMTSGDVTTKFLSENLYLSVATLNRKLKNITGMTSTIYIRMRRFIVAKQLLTTTRKSIAEIESICGFSTQGYLTRLFKSETGLTPSEYRKEHAGGNPAV